MGAEKPVKLYFLLTVVLVIMLIYAGLLLKNYLDEKSSDEEEEEEEVKETVPENVVHFKAIFSVAVMVFILLVVFYATSKMTKSNK